MYSKEKSRFSLRKNKVYGTCSVLLGITILSLTNSKEVKADNLKINEGNIEAVNTSNDSEVNSKENHVENTEFVNSNVNISNLNIIEKTENLNEVQLVRDETPQSSFSETNKIEGNVNNSSVTREEFKYSVVYKEVDTATIIKVENYTTTNPNVKYTAAPVITNKENKPYILGKTENPIRTIILKNNEVGNIEYIVESMTSATARPRREEKLSTEGTGFRSVDNSRLPRGAAILNASGMVLPIQQLASKTYWINFGDPNAKITNLGTGPTGAKILQVGTKYEKELIPDYFITAEITELRPWAGSDTNIGRPGGNRSNRPTNVAVKGPDTRWSHIYRAGMIQNIEAFFTAEYNNSNVGFAMNIRATYKGEPVVATVIAADGEEAASNTELIILQTSGTPWEIYANSKRDTRAGDPTPEHMLNEPANYKRGNYRPVPGQDIYNNNLRASYNALPDSSPYKNDYSLEAANTIWQNPNQADGGLGSQIFGPVNTSLNNSVPIVMTTSKDAERGVDIGVYINSPGNQAAVVGFIVGDKGDAPLTYGTGMHLLNYELDPTPPYLGKVPAVIDIAPGDNPWKSDDIKGDEGNVQLTDAEIIPVIKAEGSTYSMEVIANPNGSTAAYVKGFVDFNNNGVFDDTEGSDTLTVTNPGKHTLTFSSRPQVTNSALEKLGVRVRIARNSIEIQGADGVASSGEVEDFETQLVHPPRGEKKVTSGGQGQTQYSKINFTAYGEIVDSDRRNSIDENVAVKIVAPDGSLVSEWTEVGQGKYTVDAVGNVKFIPLANFIGEAKGIVLRATDKNGVSTGWTSQTGVSRTNNDGTISTNTLANINDGSHTINEKTMDAVYIPTVREVSISTEDIVSAAIGNIDQTKTIPLKKENVTEFVKINYSFEDGTNTVIIPNQGRFVINPKTGNIVFTPETTFVGTASPVKFVVTANIESEDGSNLVIKSNVANYRPTVYKMDGIDVETNDFQGSTQEGQPIFTSLNTEENTSLGDKVVDITMANYSFDNGQTETVIAGEGKYTLNPATGQVTFIPEASFIGKGQGVDVIASVNVTDSEGQILRVDAKAKYIPNSKSLEITSVDKQSKGLAGEEQRGKPEFEEITGNPNILNKAYSFEDGSVRKEISGQGVYTIDSPTGQVSFIPERTFTGKARPIIIKQTLVVSSEHTELSVKEYRREYTATYTPEVVNLIPTAVPATSKASQGDAQTTDAKVLFIAGKEGDAKNSTVTDGDTTPEEFEEILITSIKLVNPATNTPVDVNTPVEVSKDGKVVGTYTMNPEGIITFQPAPDFTGEVPAVIVRANDISGDEVTTTYTPMVTPVTSTPTDATSINIQGQLQEGRPTFDVRGQEGFDSTDVKETKYAFEGGETTKTVAGEGVYTIVPDTGKVTFTPDKQFTGKVIPVTVVQTVTLVGDDNKETTITTTAKYTSEVTPVRPIAEDATSENVQGQRQTGTPKFIGGNSLVPIDETVPATFEDGTNEKIIPGQGRYVVSPNGKVTFTPELQFAGTDRIPVGVNVRRVDINGTSAIGRYTPLVRPVVPTGEHLISWGARGKVQIATPKFTEGHDLVPIDYTVPATFEDGTNKKIIPGQGTYILTPEGEIRFIPEDTFVGEGSVQSIVRVDKNGTKAYARFTAHVTSVPIDNPTYDLPEIVIETKVPEDYPSYDLPEIVIETKIPEDYPSYDLPEIVVETKVPEDYPKVEKEEGKIGIVPKDYPSYDLPEIVIETRISEDYPTIEKSEGQIGIVPKDYPSYDLPEIVIETRIPEDYPTIEKSEAQIGIVRKDYPSYDLPEIVIETKIPEDYPTIEKSEGQIGIVPKDYPTYGLPEIVIETKVPEDYPIVEKEEGQIGIVPKDYPSYDLPEIVIEKKIPEDYPKVEKEEGQIGIVPKDYPIYDLPEIVIETKIPENNPIVEKEEGQIGIVPKDYPSYELPEIVIETKIPEDYSTIEKSEGQIGIVPKDYPTYDLPEIVIEKKIPEDYPLVEKSEGQIGIVPQDYPSYDLPEIVIETKIPEDYPTIEKSEGQIGIVPKDYPTYDLPEIVIETKVPEDYPIVEKESGQIGIVPNNNPSYDLTELSILPNIPKAEKGTDIPQIAEDREKVIDSSIIEKSKNISSITVEKNINSRNTKVSANILPKTTAKGVHSSNSNIPLALATILLAAGLTTGKRKMKNN